MEAERLYPREPFLQRATRGILQGFVAAIFVLGGLGVVDALFGGLTVSEKADRNLALSVASAEGIRCVLTIAPDPERSFAQTQALIDNCFREFDRLVEEDEASG